MPPASTPSLYTLPAGSSVPDPEFLRVLRIADPGVALDGAVTFAPAAGTDETWLAGWQTWRDGLFAPHLGPAMVAAAVHAGQGRAREIQEISRVLHAALEPRAAVRSLQTGERLLRRLGTSRGERWIGKLLGGVTGNAPLHFPVVYAAQSALFHLPLRLLLPGYAYWEWTAAQSALPPAEGSRPDFTQEIAGLRGVTEKILASREYHADHSQAAFGGS